MYQLRWVCQQPTPYNDFLFRSLASDPEIDLIVHFVKRVLPSDPWQSPMAQGFPARVYHRVLGLDWHLIRLALTDRRNFCVIGGWREPTVQSVITLLSVRGQPFALWTDTPRLYKRRSLVKAVLRLNSLKLDMSRSTMQIRTVSHPKIITKYKKGAPNGYLVPIYNIHDGFFAPGKEPQQVYLTVVAPDAVKGPHLHHIRTGFFTCIKGNVRIVVKTADGYQEFFSGEDHDYQSIEIPTGVPAAIQNLGDEDALVLNMPSPAWTPDMDDEHTADFSDYDFGS